MMSAFSVVYIQFIAQDLVSIVWDIVVEGARGYDTFRQSEQFRGVLLTLHIRVLI